MKAARHRLFRIHRRDTVVPLKRDLAGDATAAGRAAAGRSSDYRSAVAQFERSLIMAALAECGGQQVKAAARLGLLPTTLSEMMRRLGLRHGAHPAISVTPLSAGREYVWRGRLPAGAVLEIRGDRGSVSARRAAAEEGLVVAQHDRSVALFMAETDGGFAVTAVASPHANLRSPEKARRGPAPNVHFRVEVPPGVPLIVRLGSGDIELIGLNGSIDAQTGAGRVVVARARGE